MLDLIARKRVFAGSLFLVAALIWSCPSGLSWWPGLALGLIGEGVRTWGSGYLAKNRELARTGPFSVVRNPLYFGSFFLGFGIVMMSGNLWLTVLYPLLFLPVYIRKIEQEEAELLDRFGAEARDYYGEVPRLVPRLRTYRSPEARWDLQRVLFVHREWGNWLLLAAAAGWFYLQLQTGGGA